MTNILMLYIYIYIWYADKQANINKKDAGWLHTVVGSWKNLVCAQALQRVCQRRSYECTQVHSSTWYVYVESLSLSLSMCISLLNIWLHTRVCIVFLWGKTFLIVFILKPSTCQAGETPFLRNPEVLSSSRMSSVSRPISMCCSRNMSYRGRDSGVGWGSSGT